VPFLAKTDKVYLVDDVNPPFWLLILDVPLPPTELSLNKSALLVPSGLVVLFSVIVAFNLTQLLSLKSSL
tara:strand:- start:776 stop:985 length:210 start_codon:yes stop_codon:yes gene_type:complete